MIEILLSTYNGEKYLAEQLNSIINQTYQDWKLIVRDDGSTDNTLSIVNDYCKKNPNKIMLLNDKIGNVGVIRSFESLLQHSNANYMMFCDQDDVWLPNKIELTFNKMKQIEQQYGNIPILIHTDLIVVNQKLQKIADSFWLYTGLKPNLLLKNKHFLFMRNCITGCTMIINKKAKENSLPFASNIEMHDAWIAKKTLISKGKIASIDSPTILYRQHNANVCGSIQKKSMMEILLHPQASNVYKKNYKMYLEYKRYIHHFSSVKFIFYRIYLWIKLRFNE